MVYSPHLNLLLQRRLCESARITGSENGVCEGGGGALSDVCLCI